MLFTSLVGVCLLSNVLSLSLPTSAEMGETDNSVCTALHKMGVSQTGQLETFLSVVCNVKPISVMQVGKDPDDMRLCRDNIEVKINNSFFFTLDKNSGEILMYSDSSQSQRREHTNEEKMRASQCSADNVFAMAIKVLKFLGQPQSKELYTVRSAFTDPKDLIDTRFGRWEITRQYTWNNLPCRQRNFTLFVFPQESHVDIQSFYNYPIVEPEEEPQQAISKGEAVTAAKAWLAGSTPSYMVRPHISLQSDSEIVKVIALPNELGDDYARRIPDCRGVKAQYCWEVPFSWKWYSSGYSSAGKWMTTNGVLWVSLKTGKVIGRQG